MSRKNYALVTGASSGIGAALAAVYARAGYDVILIARREDRLLALQAELIKTFNICAQIVPCDLSDAATPNQIAKTCANNDWKIDVLINNAGYGVPGEFCASEWSIHKQGLQVMLLAPCELVHLFQPAMAQRGYGRILNIASVAGIAPGGKGHTLYGATKAALIKFSQSLNIECRNTGVHATAVCPGLTYSEFHDVNGMRDKLSNLPQFMWQSAEQVAERAYTASEKNKAVAVTGIVNKCLAAFAKLTPDSIAIEVMRARSKALD